MLRNAKFWTRWVWFCLLMALVPLGGNRLYAQVSTAMIMGRVMDTTGAVIADATVQVKNEATGIAQSATTDAAGRFTVPNLGVGNYEVQASKPGFSTVVHRGITLNVGAQSVVDFTLPVGQEMQTVTVEGQVSQVETTNAAVGALISQQQMAQLPLNGRNFEQLIFLAPGVSLINTMTPNARQGRAAVPSAAGARPENYVILQDDESLNNFFNRGIGTITGTSLGMEAIAEFQTLTNTYSAQFGGNGAVVNAVSKSGTNTFHGSAYAFLRNSALDARSFFDYPTLPPFRRFQPGASLGGPIKKDKMFFFVNYEGVWQLLGQTRTATVPYNVKASDVKATNPATVNAILNTLAIYPAPTFNQKLIAGQTYGTGQVSQVANQTAHEHYLLGRVDYTLSDKDSFFGRYFFDKQHVIDPFLGGGVNGNQNMPNWPERDEGFNTFATVEWKRVISPTLLNTARFSFSRPNTSDWPVNSYPALQFFPGAGRPDANISITGLSTIGQSYFVPAVDIQNKFTEADDIAWTKGSHTLRFGMTVVRLDSNVFYPFRSGSLWTFQSLPLFLAGTVFSVGGTPVGPQYYMNRDYREIDIRPYVQDDWKVTPRLTLNLGLRWEFTTNPVARHNTLYVVTDYAGKGLANVEHVTKDNPSWKSFDPRFGFAYDVFGDHKTAVRGGFAINHSPIFPAQYNPMFTAVQPWNFYSVTSPPPVYPIPNFAGAASSTAISPGWDWFINKTPYLIQYNLNIQREILPSTVLTVGYVGSHGVDMITQREMNPPSLTTVNGAQVFATAVGGRVVGNPRVNPNMSYMQMSVIGTTSRYNSMQVSLERRFSRNVQAQVNYTWSRCVDDGGSPIGSINGSTTPSNYENPYNRTAYDKGPCYFNATHNFRANGLVELPFHGNRIVEGWQLSPIITVNSGLPYSVGDGVDLVGFGYTISGGTPRPNYVSGCQVATNQVNQWFNPACFTVAPVGTLGNLGRNTLTLPGLSNVDFAVVKDTRIRESLRLQFRAEFFNIFNHAQFGQPANTLFTAGPTGACTASGAGCVSANPTAGQITTVAVQGRQIQFGLKLMF